MRTNLQKFQTVFDTNAKCFPVKMGFALVWRGEDVPVRDVGFHFDVGQMIDVCSRQRSLRYRFSCVA